jgi:hypothetical protein
VSDQLQWEGKQVLRDLAGHPHIFFRLRLSGTFFAERSSEPFIQIGRLRSRFVRIAADGLTADAYFDQPPPAAGIVEFGYDNMVYLRCARQFDAGLTAKLDRLLLPANVKNLELFVPVLAGPPPIQQ